MRLFFIRHGHTFGAEQPGGERIIMCGRAQNLPLVARGRQMARAMAGYLDAIDKIPDALYANTLLRTWEHAVIMRDFFYHHHQRDVPLILNDAFLELDYGAWAGLCTAGDTAETNEVIARFGETAWRDWQERRIMPDASPPHAWLATTQQVIADIADFLRYCRTHHSAHATLCVLGSQGTLSFLHALSEQGMQAAIAAKQHKIKPGQFSEWELTHDTFRCLSWGVSPEAQHTSPGQMTKASGG